MVLAVLPPLPPGCLDEALTAAMQRAGSPEAFCSLAAAVRAHPESERWRPAVLQALESVLAKGQHDPGRVLTTLWSPRPGQLRCTSVTL